MDFWKVLENRRTIRQFKPTAVDEQTIIKIVEAGLLAPKASNRQHWEAVLINNAAKIRELQSLAGAQDIVAGAPTLIVMLFNTQFGGTNLANVQSTAIAAQNMMLCATYLGVGSCYVTGIGDKNIIRKCLGLPKQLEPMCFILLGQPNEQPFAPPRKKADEVLHLSNYAKKNLDLSNSVRPTEHTLEQIKEHQKYLSRAYALGTDYEFYAAPEIEKIRSSLKMLLPRNAKVASLLSYDGTILKNIADLFEAGKLHDYELSYEAVAFVRFKTKVPEFKLINNCTDKYDAIISTFSFEKIPDAEVLVRFAKENLNNGGKFIVFAKNKFSFYGAMYFLLTRVVGMNTLERFYVRSGPFMPVNTSALVHTFRKFGFKCTYSQGLAFVPYELTIFKDRFDAYAKRHGRSPSKAMIAAWPVLVISQNLIALNKYFNPSKMSSTRCMVFEK